jgi:hypothetical protein
MLVSGHRAVIAALAFLGRKEEAMAAALRLRQFVPDARADADYRRLYRNGASPSNPSARTARPDCRNDGAARRRALRPAFPHRRPLSPPEPDPGQLRLTAVSPAATRLEAIATGRP